MRRITWVGPLGCNELATRFKYPEENFDSDGQNFDFSEQNFEYSKKNFEYSKFFGKKLWFFQNSKIFENLEITVISPMGNPNLHLRI